MKVTWWVSFIGYKESISMGESNTIALTHRFDHSILMLKPKASGLGNDTLRWFHSYLTDRQQPVDVSGTSSSFALIICGIPQGSILGPLLFLIYVYDMPANVKNKLLLNADDSCILILIEVVGHV